MNTSLKNWRIIDLINWGSDHFMQKGIENSRREMEWYLCDVLGYERMDLYLNFENHLNVSELDQLRNMVKRRVSGEPFQHIIGKAPFYGRDFIVNSHVLIPRFETGILIDKLKKNGKANTLLDVGTGSGCIAITCSLENISDKIYATDISKKALDMARKNMKLFSVNNIKFACHDFLKNNFNTKFDVLVSNPPYVSVDEMEGLQPEVRDYDPILALTDGDDGLIFYRHFFNNFNDLINQGGYMLLEIGGNHHKVLIENIISKTNLQAIFYKDLQGDFRAVEVRP